MSYGVWVARDDTLWSVTQNHSHYAHKHTQIIIHLPTHTDLYISHHTHAFFITCTLQIHPSSFSRELNKLYNIDSENITSLSLVNFICILKTVLMCNLNYGQYYYYYYYCFDACNQNPNTNKYLSRKVCFIVCVAKVH